MKIHDTHPFRTILTLLSLSVAPVAWGELVNPDPGSGEVTACAPTQQVPSGDANDALVTISGGSSYQVGADYTGRLTVSAVLTHTFTGTVTTQLHDADGALVASATGDTPTLSVDPLKFRYPFLMTVLSPDNDPVYNALLITGASGYSDGPGPIGGGPVSDNPDPESDEEITIPQEGDEGDYGEEGKEASSGDCKACESSSCDLTNSSDTATADASGDDGRFLGSFPAGASFHGDSHTGVDVEVDPTAGVSRSSFRVFGTGGAMISRSSGIVNNITTGSCYTKFEDITDGVKVSFSKTSSDASYRVVTFVNTASNEITRTSTFDSKAIETVWRYDSTNKKWTVVTGNGERKFELLRTDDGTDPNLRVEEHKYYERSLSLELTDPDGEADVLVSHVKKTFSKTILGWKKTKVEVLGLTGNPLTTVWEYFGPADGAEKAGLLKTLSRPDGMTQTHTYYISRSYYYHTITTPLAGGASSIVETRSKTATASTSYVYSKQGANYLNLRKDSWGTSSLAREYHDGAGYSAENHTINNFGTDFGGRPTFTVLPDPQPAVSQTYLRESNFRKLTVKKGAVSGGAVTEGAQTYTTRDKNGVLATKEVTAIGTGSGTILNRLAVASSDSYGRPTTIDYFHNGTTARWSIVRVYACCGLVSQSDKYGNVTNYAYDDVGRRIRVNRLGVTFATQYDGLTVHQHRYAGTVTSGTWSGSVASTNEVSNSTRDLSATFRYSWERSPQTEGGTHNGTTVSGGTPDLAPPAYGTAPALFSTFEVIYRNPVAGTPNPDGLPVGIGKRTIVEYVKTDDETNAPVQTTDYFLDQRMSETSGDMSPHQRSTYAVTTTGLAVTSEYVDGGNARETTVVQYDRANRIKTSTQASNVTTYTYGAAGSGVGEGKLLSVEDGDGVTTLYEYNSEGQRTTVAIDENGNDGIDTDGTDRITVTETNPGTYSGQDVWTTTTKVYVEDGSDDAGDIATVVTQHRSTDGLTSWENRLGVSGVASTVTALGSGGDYTVTSTSADGVISRVYYEAGRVVANTTWEAGSTPDASAPADITAVSTTGFVSGASYGYHTLAPWRQMTRTNSRTGAVTTTYASNTCDFVMSVEDAGSRDTLYAYDHRGRTVTVDAEDTDDALSINPVKNVTTTTYFPDGQIKEVDGDQSYRRSYTYDYADRMKTLVTYGGTAATTTWIYDTSYGRLVEKNYNGETDDGATDADYAYTNAGRLLTRTWERGVVTTYDYQSDLLWKVTYSNEPSGQDTPDLVYAYDRLGRIAEVTRGVSSQTTHATYTYAGPGLTLSAEALNQDTLAKTISHNRDSQLRRQSLDVSGEYTSGYAYDDAGRLKNVWFHPTLSSGVPQGTADFSYGYTAESFGLLASVTGPAHSVGNTWESTRDVLDAKINTDTVGPSTVVSAFDYSVNEIGQRTAVGAGASSPTYPVAWSWGYNPKGEVVEADTATASSDRAYQFDGIGNRQKAINGLVADLGGASSNYSANALNQYSVANGVTLPTTPSPAPYDADGNYTAGSLPVDQSANAAVLQWDAENRLTKVTKSGGDVIVYDYDYLGRRISKTITPNGGSASTRHFLYDGWNLIVQYTGSTVSRTYSWGSDLSGSMQGAGGVGGLLATREDDQSGDPVFYPLFDGNGNVTEYLDAGGAPVAHYEYDAFGGTLVSSGTKSGDFSYRFSTKPLDAETGLYYYGFRYNDPVTGRWPSRDLLGVRGGMNLYGFVGNRPVGGADLLGLINWQDLTRAYYRVEMDCYDTIDCGCLGKWNIKTSKTFGGFGLRLDLGWVKTSQTILEAIKAVPSNCRITYLGISAHHSGVAIWGKNYPVDPGTTTKDITAAIDPKRVADNAHINLDVCSGVKWGQEIYDKLAAAGLHPTVRVTDGRNTDVPGIPGDVPLVDQGQDYIIKEETEQEKLSDPLGEEQFKDYRRDR